ncbi:MAG: response regulator [Candidatus Acidiferrales bacterium]
MDRPTLLVVEDEPALRKLVKILLEEAGYDVLTANNGREALAVLAEKNCALVVSDVRMPEMDGLALLAALREEALRNASAPVSTVLLTGCNDMDLAVQGMQLGALDYILKPFDPLSIVASVASAIERSQELVNDWRRAQKMRRAVEVQKVQLARLFQQLEAIRGPNPLSVAAEPQVQEAGEAESSQQDAASGPGEAAAPEAHSLHDHAPTASFEIPVTIQFGDNEVHAEGKICRVNAGFLVISSPILFEAGRQLGIIYQGRKIGAEVVYCNRQDDRTFRIGLTMREGKYGNFRTEQRIPVTIPATITITGKKTPLAVTVTDISPNGLGLLAREPTSVGEMACVDLETGLAFGEIRHCEQTSITDYRLGLRIEEYILRDSGSVPFTTKFLKSARHLFSD